MGRFLLALTFLFLSSQAFANDERAKQICDYEDKKTIAPLVANRETRFPEYAFVKRGSCHVHLITIHGYVDNENVCEYLANLQNKQESVIAGNYFCIRLN